jgi:hypothetical protein
VNYPVLSEVMASGNLTAVPSGQGVRTASVSVRSSGPGLLKILKLLKFQFQRAASRF